MGGVRIEEWRQVAAIPDSLERRCSQALCGIIKAPQASSEAISGGLSVAGGRVGLGSWQAALAALESALSSLDSLHQTETPTEN